MYVRRALSSVLSSNIPYQRKRKVTLAIFLFLSIFLRGQVVKRQQFNQQNVYIGKYYAKQAISSAYGNLILLQTLKDIRGNAKCSASLLRI